MKFTPSFDLRLLSPHTIAEMQGLEKVMTHPIRNAHPRSSRATSCTGSIRKNSVIQRTVTNMITMRAGCRVSSVTE